jgi:chromate transporter
VNPTVTGLSWPERTKERATPTRAELQRFALWMGMTGFGGGLSVLASMRATAVDARRWVTDREFDNTATVAQMLPGGAAANALALVGLRFYGTAGAIGSYVGFILPGFAATLALAIAYGGARGTGHGVALLGGLSAAIVGIVGSLSLQMVRSGVRRPWQMAIAGLALLLSLEGGASSGEIALLGIGVGLTIDLGLKRARLARTRRKARRSPAVALPDEGEPLRPRRDPTLRAALAPAALALFGLATGGALASLAILFLRTGLGAYGGGFAIIPHLKATLVGGKVLTDRQFADAVAIGKLTPGPVLLLATFIGYTLHGIVGAFVATAAIFAAPLALTVGLGATLARYRSRRVVRAALRGLTPAVVGTIAAAAITLAGSLDGSTEIAIAAATGLTLVRFRVNPVLALALGGASRVVLAHFGV